MLMMNVKTAKKDALLINIWASTRLQRKTEAMPIGDFLYQLKFSLDRKRQTLMERDIQKAKELANCQYINPNSSKLLESRRVRRIKQIFDLLDTHQV